MAWQAVKEEDHRKRRAWHSLKQKRLLQKEESRTFSKIIKGSVKNLATFPQHVMSNRLCCCAFLHIVFHHHVLADEKWINNWPA